MKKLSKRQFNIATSPLLATHQKRDFLYYSRYLTDNEQQWLDESV